METRNYAGCDDISPTFGFDGTTKDDLSRRYLWGPVFDQHFAGEQVSVPNSNGNVRWPLADYLVTIGDMIDCDERGTQSIAIASPFGFNP